LTADAYPTEQERRADVRVHGAALAIATVGSLLLIVLAVLGSGSGAKVTVVTVYAVGLTAMWLASTAYNTARDPARRRALRRVDHAAIFLLIACTYTPFTTQCLEGPWALGMTSAIWLVAGVGMAVKLIIDDPPRGLSVAAYLATGWLAILAIGPLVEGVPRRALWLLALGGLVYSLGAAIYASNQLPYRRAIWHGLVLVACALHWHAVLLGVVIDDG
jgi:hemolysin III